MLHNVSETVGESLPLFKEEVMVKATRKLPEIVCEPARAYSPPNAEGGIGGYTPTPFLLTTSGHEHPVSFRAGAIPEGERRRRIERIDYMVLRALADMREAL